MYSRIIVAVDLSNSAQSNALLKTATQLIDAGGEIRLLHVLEEVPSYIAAELPRDLSDRRHAEARMELKTLAGGVDARVEFEVRSGAASGQILQAAEDSNADLIMIASHKPGLSDFFIGSTAARVVRHAQTSVLITR
ncbi:universal stress protein [Rhodobacteraceae bacterium 2376]|uniref:Universal stress protein n=1 Tax=Rhabdonatronobacter sediminivivens TaxID=2743469 RepID=A0A7Z0HZE3_9RHOB|nr:universal stress protein [Rhabdonatronobacter sediminivivens]NYS25110.1 universal stress protein [Rhabdonatronobacter sediminivivens]